MTAGAFSKLAGTFAWLRGIRGPEAQIWPIDRAATDYDKLHLLKTYPLAAADMARPIDELAQENPPPPAED